MFDSCFFKTPDKGADSLPILRRFFPRPVPTPNYDSILLFTFD
jgi:hypothetical protein